MVRSQKVGVMANMFENKKVIEIKTILNSTDTGFNDNDENYVRKKNSSVIK